MLVFYLLFVVAVQGALVDTQYKTEYFDGQNRQITFCYQKSGNIVSLKGNFSCSGNGNLTLVRKGLDPDKYYGGPDIFFFSQEREIIISLENGGYQILCLEILCDGFLDSYITDERSSYSLWWLIIVPLIFFAPMALAILGFFIYDRFFKKGKKQVTDLEKQSPGSTGAQI